VVTARDILKARSYVLVIIARAHRIVGERKLVDLAKEPELRMRRTREQVQLAFDSRQLL